MHLKFVAVTAALAFVPSQAALAFDYDELIDGDLSNVPGSPDQFTAELGTSTLRLQVVDSDAQGGDLDFFTLNIPSGIQLDAIRLIELDAGGGDDVAFIGTQLGSAITIDPQNPDSTQLLGFTLTQQASLGGDLLPDLGNVPQTDTLSFWVQQTGPDLTTIGLAFDVSPIPAPGAVALAGVAGLCATRRRR